MGSFKLVQFYFKYLFSKSQFLGCDFKFLFFLHFLYLTIFSEYLELKQNFLSIEISLASWRSPILGIFWLINFLFFFICIFFFENIKHKETLFSFFSWAVSLPARVPMASLQLRCLKSEPWASWDFSSWALCYCFFAFHVLSLVLVWLHMANLQAILLFEKSLEIKIFEKKIEVVYAKIWHYIYK